MKELLITGTLICTLLICSVLVVAFFSFRGQSNRYLLIGFFAVFLHIIYKLMWMGWHSGGQYEIPLPFGLMYPVLLYLFARGYYQPERTTSLRNLMYLSLPFFLHILLFIGVCLQPAKSDWIQGYTKIYYAASMLSLLIFALLNVKMYTRFKMPPTATDILIRQLTTLCFGLVLLGYMMLCQVGEPHNIVGFEVRPMVYLFLAIGFGLIIRYILHHDIPVLPD